VGGSNAGLNDGYYLGTDGEGNYAGGFMVVGGEVVGATSGQIIDTWNEQVLEDGWLYWLIVGGSALLCAAMAWLAISTFIKKF
jgi:hypothetical protein